jgi:transcriptional regulator with XRE-family HTH domain
MNTQETGDKMPTIGEKIRQIRIQRGLTQGELSEDLVTASMISQIEAGKAKPSYPLLTSIANRLGMPVEYFLNDLEDQFTIKAHLRLAQYALMIEHPNRAKAALDAIDPPHAPGLHYQEYHLLLSQIYRDRGDIQGTIRELEDLREHALRSQDRRLLFTVCKHAGHVECLTGNVLGAIHEWEKAIELGEELAHSNGFSSLEFNGELTELCIEMHKLYSQLGQTQEADFYLQKGAVLCRNTGRYKDIAEGFIHDAEAALRLGDAGRARNTIDRAISIIDAVKFIELHTLLSAKLNKTESDGVSPWHQAAAATVNTNPHMFIQAELIRIQQFIDTHQVERATHRIDRAFAILADYQEESSVQLPWMLQYDMRLKICKCRADYSSGKCDVAINALEGISEHLIQSSEAWASDMLMEVWARLLTWHVEQGNAHRIDTLSVQLQRATEKQQSRISVLN